MSGSTFNPVLEGIEHLPRMGAFLLVANHSGTLPLDGLMIKAAVKREHAVEHLPDVELDRLQRGVRLEAAASGEAGDAGDGAVGGGGAVWDGSVMGDAYGANFLRCQLTHTRRVGGCLRYSQSPNCWACRSGSRRARSARSYGRSGA